MKKFLSVLLCVTMLLGTLGALTVSATSFRPFVPGEPCDCEFVPIIKLTGGGSELTENYGEPDEMSYFGMFDDSGSMARDLFPGLPKFAAAVTTAILPDPSSFLGLLPDPNKITDAIIEFFDPWVSPVAFNPDGTSVKEGLCRPTFKEEFEKEQDHQSPTARYTYGFDWRLSPLENADLFNDFVQEIKELTGHEHVHIQGISGSGPLMLAYVDQYVNGVEDPDALSIVFAQTTGFGLSFYGSVLNARYNVNAKGLSSPDVIYSFVGESQANSILFLLNTFYNLGILDVLSAVVSLLPQQAWDRVYEEITRKTFAAWPGAWGSCPPEDFASARARVTSKGIDKVYGGQEFLDKIDAYHELQLNAGKVLQEASEKIKVAVLAGYNLAMIPLDRRDNSTSDGMTSTSQSSLGATAAQFGRKLPASYTQAVKDNHNHISPDRKVDASTCALPENTWFLKNTAHQRWYEVGGWYSWWRLAERGEDTVFDNPRWPQFLEIQNPSQAQNLDGFDDTNVVFLPVQPEAPGGFMDSLLNFWDTLLLIVRNLFDLAALPFSGLIDKIWGLWFK